jgi:hypothetical protein
VGDRLVGGFFFKYKAPGCTVLPRRAWR